MANPFEDENIQYLVLVNEEGQYELDSAVIPKGLFGQGAQLRTALAGKVPSMHR